MVASVSARPEGGGSTRVPTNAQTSASSGCVRMLVCMWWPVCVTWSWLTCESKWWEHAALRTALLLQPLPAPPGHSSIVAPLRAAA
eukprot:1285163-Prymnesium_polylepis.1